MSKSREITSTVRFTDDNLFIRDPSSELLGYYHSSAAADWQNDFFCKLLSYCPSLCWLWRLRAAD